MSRNASSVTTEERNYDELVGQIRCNCRLEAVLRTTGPGKKNTGRNFFACPKYSTDPSNCRFFKWADELSGPGVPTTQIPKTPLRPNPKSNLGSPALTTSVMRGSGMTPASSAPRTPQSKPRDTGASQRRLALIRAAFDSEPQPGQSIVVSTLRAVDEKPNEGEVPLTSSNSVDLKADKDQESRTSTNPAPKHKDDMSGLATPSRTPVIAGATAGGNLSPKKRRIDMDDAENNPFLTRPSQPRANSVDMAMIEACIAQAVKEGVKEAFSSYTLELRLLRGQVETLQTEIEALKQWRRQAESQLGGSTGN